MPAQRREAVLPETLAIAAVGCADLVATVALLGSGSAYEGNALMRAILSSYGPWGFVSAKALFIAVPLAIAEAARPRREAFVRAALRVCLALYVGLYLALTLRTLM